MRLQLLSERLFVDHPEHGRIFVNPTPEEARAYHTYRGFLDEDDVVWIWGYDYGVHTTVAKALGEQIKIGFYIASKKITPSSFSTRPAYFDNAKDILASNECIIGLKMDVMDMGEF